MAIKQNIIEERFGSTVPGAYIKLCYIHWSDSHSKMVATFAVFATEQARTDDKECLHTIDIDVTDSFPNLQKNMYKELKKDSKYKDAKDV